MADVVTGRLVKEEIDIESDYSSFHDAFTNLAKDWISEHGEEVFICVFREHLRNQKISLDLNCTPMKKRKIK